MIRRFVALGALVGLLGVGDIAARSYVEARADERVQQDAPPGSTIDASVGGFPFVPRLLLSTQVSSLGVHIHNLAARVITFAEVDIELQGVELNRSRLFGDRKVRIESIDKGVVEATLTQEALSEALRVPVTIEGGQVKVRVLGADIAATPSVDAQGRFTLTGTGLTSALTLTIPKSGYLPCLDGVTVLAGRLRLTCEFRDIPPALVDAAQSVAN